MMEFKITKHLIDLSEKTKGGWVKQLNCVKWGDNDEKLEIRLWHYPENSDTPDKAGKGVTLTEEEFAKLGEFSLSYEKTNLSEDGSVI